MQDSNKPLNAAQWGDLFNPAQLEKLLPAINDPDTHSDWTKEMLRIAKPGDRILEIGSGSGQASLCLAKAGCVVTALDFSESALELAASAAEALSVELRTVFHDAREPLPFEAKEFDIIFHAGLLEHFSEVERIEMLRSWKPFCKKMISMVPNAASFCYRLGKEEWEREGHWVWGKEHPMHTQIGDFLRAGYDVQSEYTISIEASLFFLDALAPLKEMMETLWESRKQAGRTDLFHQGYLLVTIGA